MHYPLGPISALLVIKGNTRQFGYKKRRCTCKESGIVFDYGEGLYAWSIMHKSWSFQLKNFLSPFL